MTFMRKIAFAAVFAAGALSLVAAASAPAAAHERVEPYWKR